MNADRIVALARQVACADPATCDRVALGELTRLVCQVRSWCDALDARIATRADELAAEGLSEPAPEVFVRDGRRSGSESRAAARRGAVCARHRDYAAALADGTISAGHVDALGRARVGLDDTAATTYDERATQLLEQAKVVTVDEFARRCAHAARAAAADVGVSRQERLRAQRTIGRYVEAGTGMCITRLALDPETDATIWHSITAAMTTAPAEPNPAGGEPSWTHLAVDATVELITGARAVDARVPEVSVLIDWNTLRDTATDAGIVCELVDGTPLAPATVRRLCCDADLIPVVVGGDGVPLDVGRSRRLATCDQRRALAAMYARCAHPDCHVTFEHCRIHHVTDWTRGGPTNLDNLVPLCSTHHHLVHEGGWTLTLDPDRTITLTRPDGTIHHTGPSTTRAGPDP